MTLLSISLTILGLVIFEVVTSLDNAVINADVLSTMGEKARRWFLLWGIIIAVFLVRGLLPWLIVWITVPQLGPWGALTASFTSDPRVVEAIATSAPVLLVGGGIFLLFIFLHWLFREEKNYAHPSERYFHAQSPWFYAVASVLLLGTVYLSLQHSPLMAMGAVSGSTLFFIAHGFKESMEAEEDELLKEGHSDRSKLFYLESIDSVFSVDGVLGAFAFTLSVPLILIGNGIGALVIRYLTVRNLHAIRKYLYLKNGAMYSILVLGVVMVLHAFGVHVPEWISPIATVCIISYFLFHSARVHKASQKAQ